MKLIAHRGNLNGPLPERENSIAYIQEAFLLGYDVEIDVWYINNHLFLGHDNPQYDLELDFLLQNADSLWIHAKNLAALTYLLQYSQLHLFSHDKDEVILTSKRIPWVYPGAPYDNKCVVVMPERVKEYSLQDIAKSDIYGICSDYIYKIKQK